MRALVIGGTGPTGPHVLTELLDRGHDVTILHRGVHEPPELPDVEHIHTDPHFAETVREAAAGREFDVVVAMYGRIKELVTVFAGLCEQFVAISGIVAYENSLESDRFRPTGMKVLARESDRLADARGPAPRFARLVLDAERAVLDGAGRGAFRGSVIRYPAIYGPRNPVPYEWSVIRRVQDGRERILVVDGGQEIVTRCAAVNAAHAVVLCTDHPGAVDGQVLNIADEDQFSTRQWIELVCDLLGANPEIVSLPRELGAATYAELHPMPGQFSHLLVDIGRARRLLGYRDVVPAERAIADYVGWLVRNPPDLAATPAFIDQFDYDAEDRLVAAYREAVAEVARVAGREVPRRAHAHSMPHPRAPSTAPDHGGR